MSGAGAGDAAPGGGAEEAVAVFGTTYRVMLADRTLTEAAVPHGLSPTPGGIESPCGICLRVPMAHAAAARGAVEAAAIEYSGFYRGAGREWTRFEP